MNRLNRSLRATLAGLVINTILTIGKLVAGLAGQSHALVADAVESLADIFSSLVVWRGLVIAEAPEDERHPYGHGKAEPIASAMVATMLLLAAAGILFNSIRGILRPETEGPRPFTLLVLLFVVVVKESLFRFVSREADTVESTAVRSDAWHHRSDAITSLAAAIGISISLIGGKGYRSADDAAAAVAALIIAWNGLRMLQPAFDELMDAAPNPRLVKEIRSLAASIPGVEEVEKCMIRKNGPHYFVDMHVEVAPTMTVQQGHAIAHQVKDKVRDSYPSVRDVLVHIEPARNLNGN